MVTLRSAKGATSVKNICRRPDWLTTVRRYLVGVAGGSLLWEVAQLPLYTIWREGTPGSIAFAVLHCTAGDILIAAVSLLGALLVLGSARWPADRYALVAALAVAAGVAYTVFSEWQNTERGSWTYAKSMPTMPIVGTGLSPFSQWLVIPTAAFWWSRQRSRKLLMEQAGVLHDQ